jgi:hypothetical protein
MPRPETNIVPENKAVLSFVLFIIVNIVFSGRKNREKLMAQEINGIFKTIIY